MPYNLIVKAEALLEIREAFEWYQEQQDNLGFAFIEEIDVCYQKLINNPDHFSYLNNRYRRIKTNRFPYLLVYEVENDLVIIFRLRHNKQRPL